MDAKKCRTLGVVSIVCAGVSLLFFGALLDIVGFIIGLIALTNAKKLVAMNYSDPYANDAVKLAKIGVVLSLVALIANLLTAAFLAPALLEGTANVSGPMF
ncbi:MAG: hypothetical protein Q4B69_05275 [Slackia sp.]|nr:hypothetical protein [Slackia sp.]